MRVSEKILRYLSKNNRKTMYGIPSGTISPIVDSLNDFKEIEYIITKNEAAASYSACKYAKVTQELGVCLMSGSVGVANAMNGIAEAAETKAPVLIIGGYVAIWQQGLGAIQELDSEKLLRGIVKYTRKVTDEKNILKELKKAMEIAMEYPRGPVHVGIPLDVQKLEYTGKEFDIIQPRKIQSNFEALDKAVEVINKCRNGLVIIGGGCRNLGDKIKKLEEKLNWRLVTTTSAKGVIEEDYRLHMGNFGFPGTDLANNYIKRNDIECILALGTKLGESATQNFSKDLMKDKLIHIDIDNRVFNRSYNSDVSAVADLNVAIDYIADKIFYKDLDNNIEEPLNKPYIKDHTGLSLRLLYEKITDILPENTFYVNDMGNSMNYCFKYLKVPTKGDFECNMNYACMGSSIGAIGISRIDTNRPIAVFIGDGSFYMNGMAELLTAKKYSMKIIYFVINNSSLSFVDKGHLALFGRTINEFSDEKIDISALAACMNIKSMRIEENEKIEILKDFVANISGPMVVDIVTDSTEPIPTNRFKDLAEK
ncbi:thiamine pyrophosphate-binding protein [Clostridium sp. DJ247]|uniref:thiamine pyrophosphate-binding protein n=1 Tax=Clostridium sp. DJ247 TaxID=2726188 RepID=UPI001629C159|nr:thiamine pyrophosphate-binding protein [Clostridium sp. DJ247]MBC2581323.1 thiamine pyrophosphate-binding protein [Clostridium sp. DJ247]